MSIFMKNSKVQIMDCYQHKSRPNTTTSNNYPSHPIANKNKHVVDKIRRLKDNIANRNGSVDFNDPYYQDWAQQGQLYETSCLWKELITLYKQIVEPGSLFMDVKQMSVDELMVRLDIANRKNRLLEAEVKQLQYGLNTKFTKSTYGVEHDKENQVSTYNTQQSNNNTQQCNSNSQQCNSNSQQCNSNSQQCTSYGSNKNMQLLQVQQENIRLLNELRNAKELHVKINQQCSNHLQQFDSYKQQIEQQIQQQEQQIQEYREQIQQQEQQIQEQKQYQYDSKQQYESREQQMEGLKGQLQQMEEKNIRLEMDKKDKQQLEQMNRDYEEELKKQIDRYQRLEQKWKQQQQIIERQDDEINTQLNQIQELKQIMVDNQQNGLKMQQQIDDYIKIIRQKEHQIHKKYGSDHQTSQEKLVRMVKDQQQKIEKQQQKIDKQDKVLKEQMQKIEKQRVMINEYSNESIAGLNDSRQGLLMVEEMKWMGHQFVQMYYQLDVKLREPWRTKKDYVDQKLKKWNNEQYSDDNWCVVNSTNNNQLSNSNKSRNEYGNMLSMLRIQAISIENMLDNE